jgi:hypothetical protein
MKTFKVSYVVFVEAETEMEAQTEAEVIFFDNDISLMNVEVAEVTE